MLCSGGGAAGNAHYFPGGQIPGCGAGASFTAGQPGGSRDLLARRRALLEVKLQPTRRSRRQVLPSNPRPPSRPPGWFPTAVTRAGWLAGRWLVVTSLLLLPRARWCCVRDCREVAASSPLPRSYSTPPQQLCLKVLPLVVTPTLRPGMRGRDGEAPTTGGVQRVA